MNTKIKLLLAKNIWTIYLSTFGIFLIIAMSVKQRLSYLPVYFYYALFLLLGIVLGIVLIRKLDK